MQNDVLDNNNLVVNNETDGRRKPSQCHEIETLSEQLHRDKRDEHRYGYHESRHDSRAPVPQEKPNDERRQKQSDNNGIADTGNGLLHDIGLVVERPDLDAGRKAWTYGIHLPVHFVGNFNGVAVRLTVDAEQHGRLAIRCDNGVDGGNSRSYSPDITYSYRNIIDSLDDNTTDFLGTVNLPGHETEK